MRRKRFKHQVDTFCEIFSGWQLISDIELLTRLEKGELYLDFINRKVYLDGQILDRRLYLLETISDWFDADLLTHKIGKSEFSKANLHVNFTIKKAGLILRRDRKTLEITMNLVGTIETIEQIYSKEKFYYEIYHLQ